MNSCSMSRMEHSGLRGMPNVAGTSFLIQIKEHPETISNLDIPSRAALAKSAGVEIAALGAFEGRLRSMEYLQ